MHLHKHMRYLFHVSSLKILDNPAHLVRKLLTDGKFVFYAVDHVVRQILLSFDNLSDTFVDSVFASKNRHVCRILVGDSPDTICRLT